jgi:hypothetical protein
LLHPKYAESPEYYIRAFLLLQKDLFRIFDFIEPADTNRECYSFRIHELLFRACVEIEANFKAILKENGYTRTGDWNMGDYKKIELSHRLSSYSVKLPAWHGTESIRGPFAAWSRGEKLLWYDAYNDTKHDRHTAFKKANFRHMVDAVSGLIVLLSAQFENEEYSAGEWVRTVDWSNDRMETGIIGDHFIVNFPNDWPADERYDFNWQEFKDEEDPFQNFPFPK